MLMIVDEDIGHTYIIFAIVNVLSQYNSPNYAALHE